MAYYQTKNNHVYHSVIYTYVYVTSLESLFLLQLEEKLGKVPKSGGGAGNKVASADGTYGTLDIANVIHPVENDHINKMSQKRISFKMFCGSTTGKQLVSPFATFFLMM